jgi:hypothetical protein
VQFGRVKVSVLQQALKKVLALLSVISQRFLWQPLIKVDFGDGQRPENWGVAASLEVNFWMVAHSMETL